MDRLLSPDTPSKEKVDELTQASYEMRVRNLDESINLAQRALQQSMDINYPEGEAQLRNHLSLFYFIRCEFEKSLKYAYEALAYYESIDDKRGIALSKYNIGSTYYRTDNFSKGLIYMLQSAKIFEELNDFHNLARVHKSTGTVYEYFQDYVNAETEYQKCIEASRKTKDTNSESNAYNPLSGLHLKQGKIEIATEFIEKSITMKIQTGDRRGLAFAIYGRGKIYIKQKRFELAEKDFLEALAMHEESGDKLGLCMVYNKLGLLYFLMHRFSESRTYLLRTAHHPQITIIAIKAYYQLYLLEKEEGNLKEAFNYLEKYLQLKESVIGTETLHVIKGYEEKSKIEALETEARIQRQKREIIESKNAELDSFFYRVSHDLKGPIASLIGLHNLVEYEVKDKLALEYFKMHRSQINRLNNI